MKRNRIIKVILAATLLLALVAMSLVGACSKPAPAPSPAPTVKPAPAPTTAPAPAPAPSPSPAAKSSRDPNPSMITVSTVPMPAGKYLMMAAITTVLNQYTRPTSLIGAGGSVAQMNTVIKGTAQLATPMSPESGWAFTGYEKYPEFQKMGKQTFLRKIMTTSIAPVHVVVMKDSPVKTLADLPSTLYNQAGQYTELECLKAMLEAYGLPLDKVSFKPIAYEEKFGAFADRRIDTLTAFSTLPGSGFMDIASRLDVRFISWDEAKLDAIVAKYPMFEKMVIPAKMYGPKQPDNVFAIAMATDILTYDALDNELAYNMVKAVLEHKDQLVKLFAGLDFLDAKAAVASHVIPYHDGAIKYYKEKGVWTDKHEQRQKELLALAK